MSSSDLGGTPPWRCVVPFLGSVGSGKEPRWMLDVDADVIREEIGEAV